LNRDGAKDAKIYGIFVVFAEGNGSFSFSSGKGENIRSILLILSERFLFLTGFTGFSGFFVGMLNFRKKFNMANRFAKKTLSS